MSVPALLLPLLILLPAPAELPRSRIWSQSPTYLSGSSTLARLASLS